MAKKTTPADYALAYALWDSENSVRMVKPDDANEHIARAKTVRYFLKLHRYRIVKRRIKK